MYNIKKNCFYYFGIDIYTKAVSERIRTCAHTKINCKVIMRKIPFFKTKLWESYLIILYSTVHWAQVLTKDAAEGLRSNEVSNFY